MRIFLHRVSATRSLGARVARRALRLRPRTEDALVFALTGELGSGKTAFTQGFMAALRIPHKITSPTFLIVRRYPIRNPRYTLAAHIDLYRIHSARELPATGVPDLLKTPSAILVVEWAERIRRLLPKATTVWIRFSHGKNPSVRIVSGPAEFLNQ